MERRNLLFASYADATMEMDHLHQGSYTKLGQWGLGQVCQQMSYYFPGSLEGFDFRLPWIIRKLIGRRLLRNRLTGTRTVPASVPPPETNETAAVIEAKQALIRLAQSVGKLHPPPSFPAIRPCHPR
jgi:hypothetical protein